MEGGDILAAERREKKKDGRKDSHPETMKGTKVQTLSAVRTHSHVCVHSNTMCDPLHVHTVN